MIFGGLILTYTPDGSTERPAALLIPGRHTFEAVCVLEEFYETNTMNSGQLRTVNSKLCPHLKPMKLSVSSLKHRTCIRDHVSRNMLSTGLLWLAIGWEISMLSKVTTLPARYVAIDAKENKGVRC